MKLLIIALAILGVLAWQIPQMISADAKPVRHDSQSIVGAGHSSSLLKA